MICKKFPTLVEKFESELAAKKSKGGCFLQNNYMMYSTVCSKASSVDLWIGLKFGVLFRGWSQIICVKSSLIARSLVKYRVRDIILFILNI